jgi:hypothetical protein
VSYGLQAVSVPVDRRQRTCESVLLFNREALEAYGVLRERAARNESRRLGFESPVLMRGNDELRGENVPDRAWRAARSGRRLVHGTRYDLAGIA